MNQNATRLFKIGSWMLVVMALIHVSGHFLMSKPQNSTEVELFGLMRSYEKTVFGGKMTMKEIVDGLNLIYGLFLVFAGLVNLTLLRYRSGDQILRAVSLLEGIVFSVGILIASLYFFWLHVVALILISGCFFLAWKGKF
jgi:hypothetical protein